MSLTADGEALESARAVPPPAPPPPALPFDPPDPTFWTWLGFAAMALGNFMAVLDIQIVASSIGPIQAGISASADELAWVQAAYLIAEVIAIPLSGYLGRAFSIPTFFAFAAGGFALASAACGAAWSIESMIVFRAVQGFFGGMLIPTTMAASWLMFPLRYRNTVQIMIGMITTIAPAIGPTLGGTITDALGWRWLFYINLAPAVLIAFIVPFALSNLPKAMPELIKKLDVIGMIALAVFLGSLEVFLDKAPGNGWLEEEKIRLVFFACVAGGAVFFWRALTRPIPIVSLSAFTNRNFAIGCVVTFTIGIGLYGSTYLQPLFLGQIRGFGPLQIGHAMFATGLAMFMTAPFARLLGDRVDPRVVVGFGIVLAAVGSFTQTTLTHESGYMAFLLPQFLRGVGFMLVFSMMTQLAFGTLRPDEIQNASGVFNLMRNLGGAIGLTLLNALMDFYLVFHKTMLAPTLDPANPVVAERMQQAQERFSDAGVLTDPALGALAQMTYLLNREATVMTFNNLFLVMGLLFLVPLCFLPFLKRPPEPPAAAPAASVAADAH